MLRRPHRSELMALVNGALLVELHPKEYADQTVLTNVRCPDCSPVRRRNSEFEIGSVQAGAETVNGGRMRNTFVSRQHLRVAIPLLVCTVMGLSVSTLILRSQMLKSAKSPGREEWRAHLQDGVQRLSWRAGKRRSADQHRVQTPVHVSRLHAVLADDGRTKRSMESRYRAWRSVAGFLDHHAGVWRTALLAGYR